jgi:sugar lactone lactonase YvrE
MGTNIYAVNSIYGTIPENFFVYNIVSGQKSTFPTGLKGKFFSPNVIEADPITGNIFIASYNENESRPGYANYSSNGYVLEYSPAGSLLNTYDCGVGPNAIVFNTDVEYVKMN